MPTAEFFENYPLYKKLEIKDKPFREPSIHIYCEVCKSFQTFTIRNHDEYPWTAAAKIPGIYGAGLAISKYSEDTRFNPDYHIQKVCYVCAACSSFTRVFFLRFSVDFKNVEKIGQYPPWSIDIEKRLEALLGNYASIYKKGLACESIAYGIGAFAYYRRIIELVIDKLLVSIKDCLPDEEKPNYIEVLVATQNSHIAEEKIALVKDLLPPSLRPNDYNPLAILHEILSEGIHTLKEEDCLEDAKSIREILIFLVDQIDNHQKTQNSFTQSMKKILDKKNERIKKQSSKL
jgi:hypothetical protein